MRLSGSKSNADEAFAKDGSCGMWRSQISVWKSLQENSTHELRYRLHYTSSWGDHQATTIAVQVVLFYKQSEVDPILWTAGQRC